MQAVDNGLSDGSTRTSRSRRRHEGRELQESDALRTPIDRGLTATPAYTPFGGYARLDRLVKRLAGADVRTTAWAVFLCTSSAGAVIAMWLHGYRLPPVWALLVLG